MIISPIVIIRGSCATLPRRLSSLPGRARRRPVLTCQALDLLGAEVTALWPVLKPRLL
jgi:hypothetical protein